MDAPYRPLPVVQSPPVGVEAVACLWCRWSWYADGDEPWRCKHPCNGGVESAPCKILNPRGQCPHFDPTRWTRIGRALGLWRAPAMVDPRVWDDES